MKKLIHWRDESGQLRCDNPTCKHVLPPGMEFGEHLIGYPCPQCGCSMLTRADYDGHVVMVAAIARKIDWINRWFGWLGTEAPPPNAVAHTIRANFHHEPHIELLKGRK